ncbi:MAG: PH domain-containing protein [Methylocella sp.]
MTTTDLRDRLISGEKIIWSGRPAQGLLLTSRDWLLIPFSLIWGGFAVFWETLVLTQTQAPSFMKLWGVPFVLIGLYLVAGRLLLDAWIRRGTQYAITNKRVLISRSGPFGKFTAMNLNRLPEASLTESANGRGTILFGQQASFWGRGYGFGGWTPSLDPSPQFIAVENARNVFELIQRADKSDS